MSILLDFETISFNRISHPESLRVQEDILSWWNDYSKSRPNLFNGRLIAYHNHQYINGSILKIDWYISNYAHYLQRTNLLSVAKPARAIYCAVILATTARTVVVGKMSSSTSYPDRLQLPGGNFELDDQDMFTLKSTVKDACRELWEEVGLDIMPSQLELWRIKTGGDFGDVGFIFKNKTPVMESLILDIFNQHLARLKNQKISPELSELLFVKNTSDKQLVDMKMVDYLPAVIDTFCSEIDRKE